LKKRWRGEWKEGGKREGNGKVKGMEDSREMAAERGKRREGREN